MGINDGVGTVLPFFMTEHFPFSASPELIVRFFTVFKTASKRVPQKGTSLCVCAGVRYNLLSIDCCSYV